MATLQLSTDPSGIKHQAIQDARMMQASIVEQCTDAGKDPPPYMLFELIGKGSFGRVYKAKSNLGRLVAVKIINIEEGDSLHPGAADTFNDILKEVKTLKLLKDAGAKNINTIIDTLLVGQSMWMVTEYCAGGSVATLMRPTQGLAEKWVIPILREVAEALRWVHKHGVIHRDIKCANVLVTDSGMVQLCDFGVAGIIETKFDKRSSVTGTLLWMAPELFDSSVAYGIEVDIWAFGSMAYEVASGFPPNAANLVDIAYFGSYLKQNCPRLEGDQYSSQLKDLVACCMVRDPSQRPPIEQIQKHPYILNTTNGYPATSLAKLVDAYKLWEAKGGKRQSLFCAGSAQGPMTGHSPPASNDEWNFGTMDEHQFSLDESDARAVCHVYGTRINFPVQPSRQYARQPPNMRPLIAPLEKVFDPNTISNYEDNARVFYRRLAPPPTSDLPLRNESEHPNVRDSLIDLDASLDLSQSVDQETTRAGSRPVSTDLANLDRCRTQDWKFPLSSASTTSTTPNTPRFQFNDDHEPTTHVRRDSGRVVGQTGPNAQLHRTSTASLIDLDTSLPSDMADFARPSAPDSDAVSACSDIASEPFDLERYTFEACALPPANRKPSTYIWDDVGFGREPSIFGSDGSPPLELSELGDKQTVQNSGPGVPEAATELETDAAGNSKSIAPSLPPPPSANMMVGTSSPEGLRDEMKRMMSSLGEHFQFSIDILENRPVYRMEHGLIGKTYI